MNTVVIGASRGLGLALTKALIEDGNKVVGGVKNIDNAKFLQEISSENLKVMSCDVTNYDDVQQTAKQASEFLGAIDTLFVNAGVLFDEDRNNTIDKTPLDIFKRTFDVNVFGVFTACQTFIPYLKKNAKVFVITSEGCSTALNAYSGTPAYALSKTTATKLAGIFNVTVSDVDFFAVHPGRMATDMNKTSANMTPEESASGLIKLMKGETPSNSKTWYIDYNGNPMV